MSTQSSAFNLGMKWFLKPYLNFLFKNEKNIYRTRKFFNLNAAKMGYSRAFQLEKIQLAGVPVEKVIKKNQKAEKVIFYIHGGAFVFCSPATHRPITLSLCVRTRSEVYVPDYRLAPEYSAPAALDDCFNAYKALLEEGVDPEKLIVAGDSAGGNLALALMLRCKDEEVRLPACLVLISPWLDISGTAESYNRNRNKDVFLHQGWAEYFSNLYCKGDKQHPYVSPIFGDFRDLPPTLIHIGDTELLFDDCIAFVEKAKAEGVDVSLKIWKDLMHVFHLMPFLPESKLGLRHIGGFINSRLGSKKKLKALV